MAPLLTVECRAAALANEPSSRRAEFHEQKAAEARAKADSMKDVEVRRTVLLVASMWKAISVHAVNGLVGQLGRLCSGGSRRRRLRERF